MNTSDSKFFIVGADSYVNHISLRSFEKKLTLPVFFSGVMFFSLGLGANAIAFLFFWFLALASFFHRGFHSKNSVLVLFLIFCYLSYTHINSGAVITIKPPVKNFAFLAFGVLSIYLSFIIQSRESFERSVKLFLFAMLFEAIFVVIYTMLNFDHASGYGKIYHPVYGENVNSPMVSNNLAIGSSVCIWMLFDRIGRLRKLCLGGLILIALFCAVYLAGRTFFLIVTLSLILLALIKPKSFFSVKLLFSCLVFLVIAAFSYDLYSSYLEYLLYRFSNIGGSARFELFSDGFKGLVSNPFGGYSVDQNIEVTNWYHNLVLDTARLGGWPSLLTLLFMLLLTSATLIFKKEAGWGFGFYLYIISFVIMQQDVILEGNRRLFLIFVCSMFIILGGKFILRKKIFVRFSRKK